MNTKEKRLNLGKVYFWYLFFVLFLQILGISGENATMETLWKAMVISVTMLYVLLKRSWTIARYVIIPSFVYLFGQLAAFALYPEASASSFINCAIVLAMTYLFLSMPYNNRSFKLEDMCWFINAFIVLMLYAVVFNFIMNPDAVLNVLSNRSVYVNMMHSFFDNKQTYGMFLFVATIVATYGYVLRRKPLYVILAFFFFGNLFICSSRTALFACLAFVLMLALTTVKTNRRIAIYLVVGIVIFVLLVSILAPLRRFTLQVLLDTDDTFDIRIEIWQDAFAALRGEKMIVGYGEGNAVNAIADVSGEERNSHNGFVQVLLTGGAVKMVLYICVLFKSLFCIRRIKRYHGPLASVLLSALVGVLVFSMGEALVLLDTSAPCIVASVVCAAFPIAIDGYYQHGG